MAAPLKSQQELYDLFILTLQTECPQLTDTLEGSIDDGLGGTFSIGALELQRYITAAFNKTFFDLANGPEVTGGPDDLQTLAVDHFGSAFSRPTAKAAIDVATFSRPTLAAGSCTILSGTVIKTQADANGDTQRYTTDTTVVMSGAELSKTVNITAVVAGAAGSAAAGTINQIESSLTDSSIVVTNAGNATGADAQDDATYRETIRSLLVTLRAAVIAAIEATAEAVAGVVTATAVEVEQAVINFNVATQAPVVGTTWYYIPLATLYIADLNGTANQALLDAVKAAVDPIKAFGVYIRYIGATPVSIDWTAHIALNPSGPNFAILSNDTSLLTKSMAQYIAGLSPGTDFIRATADAALLALWGPAGSNDLTSFSTTIPTGDVTIDPNEVAIAGTIATV